MLIALAASAASGCAYPDIAPPGTAVRTTEEIRHRPFCAASIEARNFQRHSKPKLSGFERFTGALSTPFKHLSTSFDGPGAWRDTGCDAQGIGKAVWPTAHSTDGLYTVDLEVLQAWVNGECVPPGRFVRLEVLPGWLAHDALRRRLPQAGEIIAFSGPLIWDKDKKAGFPDGHMEIHPRTPIAFLPAGANVPSILC